MATKPCLLCLWSKDAQLKGAVSNGKGGTDALTQRQGN
jgi:hypothetical protein